MVETVQKESEFTVGHRLKIDQIYLTARPQAARHDGLDAWHRPKTRFALDADGAGTGEELGANSTDVVDTLTNTSKQGITLTVVGAVMVFDVGVSFLQIAVAEDCVDVGILLEGLKSCNLFKTDDNNKPTLTIIHQFVE
jgi:hypothetical protein